MLCNCNRSECPHCENREILEEARKAQAEWDARQRVEGEVDAFMSENKWTCYQIGVLAVKGMSVADMVKLPEIPMEMSHEALGILHNWCRQIYLRDITKVSPRLEAAAIVWAQVNGIMPANNWPAWV